jgi:hypothetical protein
VLYTLEGGSKELRWQRRIGCSERATRVFAQRDRIAPTETPEVLLYTASEAPQEGVIQSGIWYRPALLSGSRSRESKMTNAMIRNR